MISKFITAGTCVLALSAPAFAGSYGATNSLGQREAASVRTVLLGNSETTIDRTSNVKWEGETSTGALNVTVDFEGTFSEGEITDVDVAAAANVVGGAVGVPGVGGIGGVAAGAAGTGEVMTGDYTNIQGNGSFLIGYEFSSIEAKGIEDTTINSVTNETYTDTTSEKVQERYYTSETTY